MRKLGGSTAPFSMSALQGVWALRYYRLLHPHLGVSDIVASIRRTLPDSGYHDYVTAIELDAVIQTGAEDFPQFVRRAILDLVHVYDPWWLPLATKGREKLRAVLTSNEEQCFEDAQLFESVPNEETLEWWDALAAEVRSSQQQLRSEQGRLGERLTLQYETERLRALGIAELPRWIALDDNSAGYDVLSFETGSMEPVAKLIEVKTCSREVPQFHLTTNEWRTALERGDSYRFHLWLLPERTLLEFSPSHIAAHVPLDQGQGEWQDSVIVLPPELLC